MLSRCVSKIKTDRPWLGVNFWSRRGGPLMWREYDDTVVREELTTLAEHGLTLTRSFFYWPDFHPAPDVIDETYVERYQQFLRACEDIGIATIPTFIVGHMSGANWDVPWRGERDLYGDGFMLGQQAFFIREMVHRVGASPMIAGWLISNEVPLYGGRTSREKARAWGLICTQAVRAGGSALPVSLGDGAWTQEVTGRDNGFRLRDQLDIVDFFGPHSYPMGDDQTRQFVRAAWICELAQLGKPVVLEEFGVTSSFVDDVNAGHYYRQVLHHSLLAGASGWIGWNNTDFDLLEQDPYRHHPYELNFGITDSRGRPKAALHELARFRAVLDAVDVRGLDRVATRTAVLLPAQVDLDLPMIDGDERVAMPDIAMHAWIAARAAGLTPVLARESEGIPAADLLIVGSNKALLGTTFRGLEDWVRGGGHVYLSWFSGIGNGQRGAWWPDIEPLFGARHRLRYGLSEIADDTIRITTTTTLGTLPAGTTLTFAAAGPEHARAFLPLAATTGEVVAVDQHDRPALVRHRLGDGIAYLGAYPLEYFGSARRDAHVDDEVWRLYAALGADAGITPQVITGDPTVWADQMVHSDGSTYTWLVNTGADSVTVKPQTDSGDRLVDVLTGDDVTDGARLDEFGVIVTRHQPCR
jgi:endo-1,4-beta-mannosidase